MIVGLPGAGISTLFYLLCVLLMPVHTLYLVARHREARAGRWRVLMRQLAITAGILTMLALMAVGLSITWSVAGLDGPGPGGWAEVLRTLGRLGTIVAAVTLSLVLASIKGLSLVVPPVPSPLPSPRLDRHDDGPAEGRPRPRLPSVRDVQAPLSRRDA